MGSARNSLAVRVSSDISLPLEPTGSPLTERQLAALIGVSMRTVQRWRENHQGPPWFKAGGCIRFPRTGVIRFIDDRMVAA